MQEDNIHSQQQKQDTTADYAQQTYDKAQEYYHAHIENYATKMKGKTGIRRIINALYYSLDGLKAACEESGFRQLLLLNAVSLPLLYFLDFHIAVKMLLITVTASTLIVELLNTGLEAAVDHTSLEKNDLAKRAKDVGSAAQYLTLILLGLLWIIALWHRYG